MPGVEKGYRAWLPQEALDLKAAEDLLAQAVERWSRKWFAAREVRLAGAVEVERPAPAIGERFDWHLLEEGLAVGIADRARVELARAVLDLRPGDDLRSPADKPILNAVAAGCLEDLRGSLCDALRVGRDSVWRTAEGSAPDRFEPFCRCEAEIAGGGPRLRFLIDRELLVALLKLGVKTTPAPLRLRPVADALARQPVRVSAFVGASDLSLVEASALAAGDVLILDEDAGAPLDLALDSGPRSGRCIVERDGDRLRLHITEPFCE